MHDQFDISDILTIDDIATDSVERSIAEQWRLVKIDEQIAHMLVSSRQNFHGTLLGVNVATSWLSAQTNVGWENNGEYFPILGPVHFKDMTRIDFSIYRSKFDMAIDFGGFDSYRYVDAFSNKPFEFFATYDATCIHVKPSKARLLPSGYIYTPQF